jgi:hypothetical protein
MNKLGFYTEWFGGPGVVDAIKTIKPPTLLSHVNDNDALRKVRAEWSPGTFIIGRPFVLPPTEQDRLLDSNNPAEQGARLAERILNDFPIATERVNGRLVVDAWMALNESVRGPNSFPAGYDHSAPDYQEMIRRAAAYDALERAFQNRLVEQGLQAVAFNFGAGNWARGEDYITYFPKTLATHTYLGFHEYGWPHMNPAEPGASSACGIYRGVMQVLRAQYSHKHRAIITEAGLARMYMHGELPPQDPRSAGERDADVGWLYQWDSVAEENYKRSLRWYNQHLLADDYVVGACLFQVGPGGKWTSFRHTGEDNQGRTLTLMDELQAMAQEPAPEPVVTISLAAAPPVRTLVDALRDAAQPLIIPLNPDAKFYKVARESNLGERLTGEYEVTYDDQCYVAQLYERGLVYAPAGQWGQTQVIPIPRTRAPTAAPEIAWTHHITGFHGNRWQYWETYLKDRVPGLTWDIFSEDVLEHNPGLAGDGYVFRADKTYLMPQVPGQTAAPAEQPAGAGAVTPAAPDGFVRLEGDKFCIKGEPKRFLGVNIRGLVHYGHDPDYFKHAPAEHRVLQLQAASDMNARLVRVFLAHKDATPPQIEGRLREVLDLIRSSFPDIYLLPALTNLYKDVPFYVRGDEKFYASFPNSDKEMLNKAFFEGGYREHYLPFVEHIVKAFRDEPHIFAWEIGNELKAEAEPEIFVAFNKAVAAAIKSWDPYHLVTTGMVSTRHAWMKGREDLRQDLYGSPHINFVTIHAYNGNEEPDAIEDDSDLARAFGKPYIIEEAGFDRRKYPDRPEKTRTDLAGWFRRGASSYLPWGFVATPGDNNDGDAFVGLTGPLIPDWKELYLLYKQCGHLLLTSTPAQPVSEAIASIDYHPVRAAPGVLPWPLVVDGFDFPVGAPDGLGYYVAADLANQAYHAERGSWHTGEDWNRKLRAGDTPDVDLGDPVYAIAHGRVVTSYAFPTWGNIVLIEHLLPSGQTVWSQYAHLQQRLVAKGDVVQRGDRIGSIGKGADDRYPAHLHFEIRLKDLPASKWGWKTAEDREQVLQAYAHPTNFINSQRPS